MMLGFSFGRAFGTSFTSGLLAGFFAGMLSCKTFISAEKTIGTISLELLETVLAMSPCGRTATTKPEKITRYMNLKTIITKLKKVCLIRRQTFIKC